MADDQTTLSSWLNRISVPTYILVMLFAISSWIDINGVWVELPLLVAELPESWDLPSYLVIIIQVANIGPLIYTVAKKLAPNKVREWPVIYLIIGIGIVACLLLAFFWSETTVINGSERSVALLTLCALLSLVDCTSSVVFLPFMAHFPAQYLTAFYIGGGLSGLVPALVGLGQGIGGEPECRNRSIEIDFNVTNSSSSLPQYSVEAIYPPPAFSVSVFFFILFGLLCVSALSFTAIKFHPHCRRQMIVAGEKDDADQPTSSSSAALPATNPKKLVFDDNLQMKTNLNGVKDQRKSSTHSDVILDDSAGELQPSVSSSSRTGFSFIVILLLIAWTNALTNGALPSLQSYSCLPYGNTAYNLAVKLSAAVNPLACLLALFFQVKSLALLGLLGSLGTILSGYHIALAALSPEPPLVDSDSGAILAVTSYVLLTALFSYFKVCAASRLASKNGASGLLWCGCFTQIGSLIGAVITFLLVNVFDLFTSKYACS